MNFFFIWSKKKQQNIYSYIKWSGGLCEHSNQHKGVAISFAGVTVIDLLVLFVCYLTSQGFVFQDNSFVPNQQRQDLKVILWF